MNTLETPEGETDEKILVRIDVHIVKLEEKANRRQMVLEGWVGSGT